MELKTSWIIGGIKKEPLRDSISFHKTLFKLSSFSFPGFVLAPPSDL